MTIRKPSSREVRKARSFLQARRQGSRDIPPRKFAAAAKELNIGFAELLKFIAMIQLGSQGQSIIRMDLIRKAAEGKRV